MLSVETLQDETALARLDPEWNALDASLSPRVPFTSPLWCRLWWRHFARVNRRAHDRMRVFAVRDGARLIAVAPMMLTCRPSVGPIKSEELQFFGADANLTEVRGPVCRPEDLARVLATLENYWKTSGLEWDWVQWVGLRRLEDGANDTPPYDTLRHSFALSNHYLILPDDWDAFRASLPRNIKESLRKCYNSLSRDGHAFTLRVVSEPGEAEAALCRFLDLHRRRSHASDSVPHPDVFADLNARRFLLDYGLASSGMGNLRIFQLVIAGEIVATRIGIVLGDEVYLYYSGYDPNWGRYSVMTTVVAEAIRWAIEHRVRVLNLGTGTDVSKTRWRPQKTVFAGGYWVAQRPWARLIFAVTTHIRRRRSAR
ncbi:GNAT family N-acetyltransferase [uncultured Methylobacterium sp.]|uniref:GNAT family N-acetyltransferase n=1 Tax=uncultured Methylobacterium sp. TaxID=157278 RepID=UPI0035CBE1D4